MDTVLSSSPVAGQSHPNHRVQFYKKGEFIAKAVADFLAAGFRHGNPLLLVATGEHRDEVFRLLEAGNFDPAAANRDGKLLWLDAQQVMGTFMVDGMPDPDLFIASIGAVLKDLRIGREHLTIRAFGEMVDLLLEDGKPEAALRLEELWNSLGPEYGFSLLCAYTMGNLFREEHWRFFRMVCDQHVEVSQATIEAVEKERASRRWE